MANPQRLAGNIQLKIGGIMQDCAGEFTYNLGAVKREELVGTDGVVHGYKETPQAPFIEGMIRDKGTLDVLGLLGVTDSPVVLSLANGKTISLNHGWFAGDGNVSTQEATIAVKFVGKSAVEIKAS